MKTPQLKSIVFVLMSLAFILNSCSSKKGVVYSNNRYTPLPNVGLEGYKSPQLRANQNPDKTIGVALSGGGARAQYFGFGVLIGLDALKMDESTFLNEVDYFSSVSGGGFGIGYYMSLEHNNVLQNHASLFDYWKSDDRKSLLQEFLVKKASPISILQFKKNEKNKVKKAFPILIDHDLLQYGKSYRGEKIERLYLRDFFVPQSSKKDVTLPMFVANGTIYNNGERFPFMPHIIDSVGVNGSLIPIEEFDIATGMPLSYAISGSAAFPGVLPMLKLTLVDKPDKIVRIVDGGLVDNLGFTTLFELLNCDSNTNQNKSMLIIDCGGLGAESREQNTDRVKLSSLLSKSLFYSVDIKLLYSNNDIDILTDRYNLYDRNIKRIGINTIKDKFIELESGLNDSTLKELEHLKTEMLNGKMSLKDLHSDLAKSHAFRDYNEDNLSELPSDRFSEFTTQNIFEIYELASQVITKLKIDPWEKEILILAGRYTVYLEKEGIIRIGA